MKVLSLFVSLAKNIQLVLTLAFIIAIPVMQPNKNIDIGLTLYVHVSMGFTLIGVGIVSHKFSLKSLWVCLLFSIPMILLGLTISWELFRSAMIGNCILLIAISYNKIAQLSSLDSKGDS